MAEPCAVKQCRRPRDTTEYCIVCEPLHLRDDMQTHMEFLSLVARGELTFESTE